MSPAMTTASAARMRAAAFSMGAVAPWMSLMTKSFLASLVGYPRRRY